MKHTSASPGKRFAATIGAVATISILGGAGLASASNAPPSPASSGTEHFYLMTTQPSASRYAVIATGLFTAGGVDISGSTTDHVKVRGGSFKIHHGTSIHIVKQVLNPKTCLGQFRATASFTIGGGTGAYKKLSGSGKAVISELAIFSRTKKGACNPNGNAQVNEQTITGTAHVKL